LTAGSREIPRVRAAERGGTQTARPARLGLLAAGRSDSDMAEITAATVKKLRDITGAGMMECKAALTEAGGNIEEATTILRKRGLAQATKKAGRSTNEGLIGSYIHMGGKIGVLVEVNCESDFVARTEDFQNLAREIAMHIAAASPQYVRREEVPAEVLEREKDIYRGQMAGQNKPAAVIDKIIEGKLGSFYEQVCLLDQPSIRDPKVTIGQAVQAAIAKLGENISVARFVRFKLGETA
jgi:elongation factor Ts